MTIFITIYAVNGGGMDINMIECNNLSKSYKNKKIIKNAAFTLNDNSITFLMGKNGCGKTTIIKCITGLEVYSGTIKFDGELINKNRENCFVVYDDCPLYTNLSGYDNIRIMTSMYSKSKIFDIAMNYLSDEILKSKVKTYSYGQKKKLFLIIIDIIKPKYIFMDEISNGLDYSTMKNLKIHLRELAKTSCILLTGHQFSFYNDIIDKLYCITNGEVKPFNLDNKIKLEEIYENQYMSDEN